MNRRNFLASALAGAAGVSFPWTVYGADPIPFRTRPPKPSTAGRKPLAAVCTVYHPMSHAYHIVGRYIHGYALDGKYHLPKHHVASVYIDQFPNNDVGKDLCKEYDIRLAKDIESALTLGTGKLAVDGVLLIGEHGNYPRNDKGQVLYPRHEMMEQIVKVFKKTGQSVPVFNDKHLSYSWTKSKEMYQWSQELKFPFMAGSSLPVVWRKPSLELPLGCRIKDAMVAAYGPIEIYGFHALETLQTMVERRKGGESGVKAVTCLTGDEVWKAGDNGQWSWDLLEAALGRSETLNPGPIRGNVGLPVQQRPSTPPIAFLVEYRDGLRGTILLLNGHIQDFCFAATIEGEAKPASCMMYLPIPPGAKFFDALNANIEKLFENKRSPYPVERTLLTSGVLDFAMESNFQKGKRVETPDLEVKYEAPVDSGFLRGPIAAPV
jgi:hypothetical protein